MLKIPKYAQSADPSRLVKILCKGSCGKVRLAELNLPYPGKELLKKAEMHKYRARCLYCGREAVDNYNWFV